MLIRKGRSVLLSIAVCQHLTVCYNLFEVCYVKISYDTGKLGDLLEALVDLCCLQNLVKEKDEEKERFNGITTGLLAEKEKDKVDKDAMLDRMSQIEAMLTTTVRR
ncbi:hypothetical protein Hanom_Chr03g00226951 [Helianthus anomalus]